MIKVFYHNVVFALNVLPALPQDETLSTVHSFWKTVASTIISLLGQKVYVSSVQHLFQTTMSKYVL